MRPWDHPVMLVYMMVTMLFVWRSDAVPDVERSALLDIYDACNPPWTPYVQGYEDPCDPLWDGLVCIGPDDNQNILNIQLQEMLGATCSIPKSIGVFVKLRLLDLSKNELTGTIPEQLYRLPDLQHIDFGATNGLVGTISTSVGQLHSLVHLDFSFNQLNGTIPETLYNLTNLVYLSLQQNKALTGTISPSIGNLTQLTNLFLSSMNLNGPIPDSIGYLHKLLQLQFLENNLGGTVPSVICNLTTLTGLWLNGNSLEGNIPDCINNLAGLQYLYFSDNNLDGGIPESIYELPNLLNLYVGGNSLGGNISYAVGNLGKNLVELHLGQAQLDGSIPDEIGTLIGLTYLNLGNNYLTGTMPESIGNMKNLSIFIANGIPQRGERLEGSFPEAVFALPKLQVLMLATNNFNNTLPNVIGAKMLQQLDLSDNLFTGSIPASIFNATGLQNLKLSHNMISGTISPSISNLKWLQQLELNDNQLTGWIPAFFKNTSFGSPTGTVLSDNPFFCPVPSWAEDFAGAQCTLWQYTTVSPDHGNNAAELTLIGNSFSIGDGIRCEFGEFGSTNVTFFNNTMIVCPTPDLFDFTAATVPLAISFKNITINSTGDLPFYYFGTPYVNSTDPESGRQQGRTEVVVMGRNFAATDKWQELYCSFNDKTVNGTFINSSAIMCISPEMDPGDVTIAVSNSGNDSFAESSVLFTYFEYCDGFPYCSGNGDCNTTISPPVCECEINFQGDLCEMCSPSYYGASCAPCPDCGSHGVCNDGIQNDGKCKCSKKYFGKLCAPCPNCNHGTCDDGEPGSGKCKCHLGYGGDLCDSLWKVYAGAGAIGLAIILVILFVIFVCVKRRRMRREEEIKMQQVAVPVAAVATPDGAMPVVMVPTEGLSKDIPVVVEGEQPVGADVVGVVGAVGAVGAVEGGDSSDSSESSESSTSMDSSDDANEPNAVDVQSAGVVPVIIEKEPVVVVNEPVVVENEPVVVAERGIAEPQVKEVADATNTGGDIIRSASNLAVNDNSHVEHTHHNEEDIPASDDVALPRSPAILYTSSTNIPPPRELTNSYRNIPTPETPFSAEASSSSSSSSSESSEESNGDDADK